MECRSNHMYLQRENLQAITCPHSGTADLRVRSGPIVDCKLEIGSYSNRHSPIAEI